MKALSFLYWFNGGGILYPHRFFLWSYPSLSHPSLHVLRRMPFLRRHLEIPSRKEVFFSWLIALLGLISKSVERTDASIHVIFIDGKEVVLTWPFVHWNASVFEGVALKRDTIWGFGGLKLSTLIWRRPHSVLAHVDAGWIMGLNLQMSGNRWFFHNPLKVRELWQLKGSDSFFLIYFHALDDNFLQFVWNLWFYFISIKGQRQTVF